MRVKKSLSQLPKLRQADFFERRPRNFHESRATDGNYTSPGHEGKSTTRHSKLNHNPHEACSLRIKYIRFGKSGVR